MVSLDFRSEQFYLSLKSIGLFVLVKRKIDFQDGLHGGHPGFPFLTILAIIDLQVHPKLPTKFQVNWPFDSRGEAKYFFIYKSPRFFLPSFESIIVKRSTSYQASLIGLSVEEKK